MTLFRKFLILLFCTALAACGATNRPLQTSGPANPTYKVGNPYKVAGKTYRPEVNPHYDQTGMASWYGSQFHGRKTANGDIFNIYIN